MYQGRGDVLEVPGVFGTVGPEGRFRRAGRTPTDQLGTWSPDGRYFAYVADHLGSAGTKSREAIWVQDTLVDSQTELNLPPRLVWDVVAWESATEVLLATWGDELDDDVTGVRALVRCDVALGTCERPRGAPSGSVRLPE